MSKSNADSYFKEFYLDSIVHELDKELKSQGKFKKFMHDFKYLRGVGGISSRILASAAAGPLITYFIVQNGFLPYVISLGLCGAFLVIPPVIRRTMLKNKANNDQIFKAIYNMKEDLDASIYNIKRGVRDLQKAVNDQRRTHSNNVTQKLEAMDYICGPLKSSVKYFNNEIEHLQEVASSTKDAKLKSRIDDFVEKATEWKEHLEYLYDESMYAAYYINDNAEYEEDRELGNKIIMYAGGLPYKSVACGTSKNIEYENVIQNRPRDIELGR